jgi:hypothetical protein
MFSFNTCHFVLLVAASLSAVTYGEQASIDLGTAGGYAILAKTGISTVPASTITGDIGVSPIASAAMTGFSLLLDSSGQFSTSTQVTGTCVAASYGAPISTVLTTAVSDMETAYSNAAGTATTSNAYLNPGDGQIGGLTLGPGVYEFTVDIAITTDVYLTGGPTDVFILKTTGSLSQASGKKVILKEGVLASNIFWQVAGHVTVGTTAHMEGVLLVKNHAVFMTGSSLNGRVLAQTAVTLDSATITQP